VQFYNRQESEKRRKKIVEEYNKNPSISLSVLAKEYNISREGARKLLKKSGIVFSENLRVWEQQNVKK
tara:strand:- start:5522 stop:5725 length:204 start_codon:yes stop_codon:yes gene_type:complete